MWFGDEGIGDGRHGYLGSEKAVPAQEVPGLGRPQDQGSGELTRQRPGLATARNCDGTHHISRGAYRVLAGPAALTSSCVLPFLPFLFWQIRLEHLRVCSGKNGRNWPTLTPGGPKPKWRLCSSGTPRDPEVLHRAVSLHSAENARWLAAAHAVGDHVAGVGPLGGALPQRSCPLRCRTPAAGACRSNLHHSKKLGSSRSAVWAKACSIAGGFRKDRAFRLTAGNQAERSTIPLQ